MEKVKKKEVYSPKRVVYLLGAGATQAEADNQGGEAVYLLMRNSGSRYGISYRIIERSRRETRLRKIVEGLQVEVEKEKYIDIEKLISLLANTSINSYRKSAEKLRKLYYDDIREHIAKTEAQKNPDLAVGLLEMHNSKPFNEKTEKLTGIISLNHDNLFQIASERVHKCINLGFEFKPSSINPGNKKKAPLLIQLHGSFNWKNSLPIKITKQQSLPRHGGDMLWIPPAILKESKDYPFNKLMGLAYELLAKDCDILRVIGCSLSQNDWNIVSLLFNTQYDQYYHNKGTCFRIELIMAQKDGRRIQAEYSFLRNIVPIGNLEGGLTAHDNYDNEYPPQNTELSNPFKHWLREKASFHVNKSAIDLTKTGSTLRKILGDV